MKRVVASTALAAAGAYIWSRRRRKVRPSPVRVYADYRNPQAEGDSGEGWFGSPPADV